jgi:hypothetical protein
MSVSGAVHAPLRRTRIVWVVLIILAVALRVPLLFGGYGTDNDAWRNIVTTERMHAAGHYVPSRAPGFPVFEGLLLLLAPGGWVATNAAAIIAGLIALWVFYLLLKELQVRERLWTWIALAFGTPLLVNASQTMDYNFGLAAFLACYLFLLRRRYALAGAMMGLATGCRPSYMLCNLAVLMFLIARREGVRVFVYYAVSYLAVSAVVWAPAILSPELAEPGNEFLKHVRYQSYDISHVIHMALAAIKFLLGKFGAAVLFVAVTFMVISRPRAGEQRKTTQTPLEAWLFELGVVLAIGGLFALVPGEGIYLMPILPLVLMAVARLLPRPWLIAFVIAIIAEPLVTVKVDSRKLSAGTLFQEMAVRKQDLADARELLAMVPQQPTIYVVHRFMIFQLVMLGEDMVPTETTWSVRPRSGVALRSGTHDIGYAYKLETEDEERLRSEGWDIVQLHYR